MARGKEKKETYTADDLIHLEYPVSIWKRPSMYLGERGGQQSVGIRELTDNATQEGLRGYADHVRVTFCADGSIIVQDNGRGLPVDVNKKTGENGIILTMATLHAGANFNSNVKAGQAGAGLNGVGASVTNALAKRFDVRVFRNNRVYELSFQDGYPGHFKGEGPEASFTSGENIKSSADKRPQAERKAWKTGTWIRIWYNPEHFPKDEHVDRDDLIDRLRATSYIIPKLRIDVVDELRTNEDGSPYEWSFYSEHGIPEMVESIAPDDLLDGTTTIEKSKPFEKKGIYSMHVEGHYDESTTDENAHPIVAKRTVTADLGIRWGVGHEKTLQSYVNTIRTHMGGVHETALEKAVQKTFSARMKSMRGVLTSKDEPPVGDDFFDGATVVLSINVPEPQFIGQQKDRLSGPEVGKALTRALSDGLDQMLHENKKQDAFREIFKKIRNAANDRKAADDAKLAKRQSRRTASASLPDKLADCDMAETPESELLICEGDSAAGTIKKARDSTYQAVIPIRGKILNCFKSDMKAILANKEIQDIAKCLGAGLGENFDIEKCRYGRVIFAADADVDGLQINNLLYTVFNRMFRPLIDAGWVFQAVSPLFEIRVGSGKNQTTEYAINEEERDRIVARLKKSRKTYDVQRDKGLGEMDAEDFSHAVLDPDYRYLKKVVIDDEDSMKAALDLTMGESSQEKKDFISNNFDVAVSTGLIEGYEGIGNELDEEEEETVAV